jgi:hypothetical protein
MGIPFRHLRHRLHRLLLRGTREADCTTLHAPSTISADPDTVAEAARIIVPYIADAYGKSGRSTAAGLAKALEVLRSLEHAGRNK